MYSREEKNSVKVTLNLTFLGGTQMSLLVSNLPASYAASFVSGEVLLLKCRQYQLMHVRG
jgi:hypothetical protein